jgi:hypothetical protein
MIPEFIYLILLTLIVIITFLLLYYMIRLYITINALRNSINKYCGMLKVSDIKQIETQINFIYTNYYRVGFHN